MTQYDLVIRRGTIVDGTGDAPVPGDLAISNGKIAAIGKVAGTGAQEIDATGKIVTSGFVDDHTRITMASRSGGESSALLPRMG